jgi:hypothetical protein
VKAKYRKKSRKKSTLRRLGCNVTKVWSGGRIKDKWAENSETKLPSALGIRSEKKRKSYSTPRAHALSLFLTGVPSYAALHDLLYSTLQTVGLTLGWSRKGKDVKEGLHLFQGALQGNWVAEQGQSCNSWLLEYRSYGECQP